MPVDYRPPDQSYRRRYSITDHAVTRLRERCHLELRGITDAQIRGWLDNCVYLSAKAGRTEDINDAGVPAKLVDMTEIIGDELSAVVKKNDVRYTEPFVVITVLPADYVAKYRETRWNQMSGAGSKINSAFADLKDLISITDTPLPDNPPEPQPKTVEAPPVRLALVEWTTVDGHNLRGEYTMNERAERVDALLRDPKVEHTTVRVWLEDDEYEIVPVMRKKP